MVISQKPDGKEANCPPLKIIGLRPTVTGLFASMRCQGCGQAFEGYQPTVAGVAVGKHACPRCRVVSTLWPEEVEEALAKYLPTQRFEKMRELTTDAARLTETWYRHPTLAPILTYEGINLAEPTERGLASFFTLGLCRALSRRKDHDEELHPLL